MRKKTTSTFYIAMIHDESGFEWCALSTRDSDFARKVFGDFSAPPEFTVQLRSADRDASTHLNYSVLGEKKSLSSQPFPSEEKAETRSCFLTASDEEYLLSLGYPDRDLLQIEEASSTQITTYELVGGEKEPDKYISRDAAIQLLGRKAFLSGLARSAFHWSACREAKRGKRSVLFDSSRLFK